MDFIFGEEINKYGKIIYSIEMNINFESQITSIGYTNNKKIRNHIFTS
jgi:hypothetical protein